jgi:DnaJ-class molecular chaperone
MQENPFNRASFRFYEALREETQNWLKDLMKGAFDPAGFAEFARSMGIDPSRLAGLAGQGPVFSPYLVLDLDSSASEQQVKQRYRELVHYVHPDTAAIQGTGGLFLQVQLAYDLIKKERGWR